MKRFGLTRRQSELLLFLSGREHAGQPSPSFDEMASHLDLRSKSAIHRLITELEERGHIIRLQGRARSIKVVDPQRTLVAALDEPRITVPMRIADRLGAYCRRRRVRARDVISDALEAYMEVHP